MENTIQKYPPPWVLSGSGLVFAFLANTSKILELADMSLSDRQAYRGGIGAIILANYASSNAGPYYELLIIPGDFEYQGKLYKRITKIYVSTYASVENGKENWGIPKEIANFEWRRHGSHTSIKINDGSRHLADITYSSNLFAFPISTSIMPLSIVQEWKGKFLKTTPEAKGLGKLATIDSFYINPTVFPPLENSARLFIPVGLSIESFSMTFPAPAYI